MTGGDWFHVQRLGNGITMIREIFVRMFLVEGSRDVAVIDTGLGIGDLPALVQSITDRQPIVLQTHTHWDHIGNSHRFERVHVSPREADDLRNGLDHQSYRARIERVLGDLRPPGGFDLTSARIPGKDPTGFLNHAETIDIGDRVLEIYETPGHSPGGVSILDRRGRALFVGDAVGHNAIPLCLPGSDPNAYRLTLDTLVELVDHVDQVFPCHSDPIRPADVRRIREAYLEVWNGRKNADRQEERDYGGRVLVNVYDFGPFQFLIDPDKLGEARRNVAS